MAETPRQSCIRKYSHCAWPIIWKAFIREAELETVEAATTLATLAVTAATTAIVIVFELMKAAKLELPEVEDPAVEPPD